MLLVEWLIQKLFSDKDFSLGLVHWLSFALAVALFDQLMENRKRAALTEGREETKKKRLNKDIVQQVEKNVRQANRTTRIVKPKSPISARAAVKPLKPKSTRSS